MTGRDMAASVERMLQDLGSFQGINASSDTIVWKHEKDAKFTVNKLYRKEILKKPGCQIGPLRQVWDNPTPTHITCFTWLVTKKASLTHERLKRRGMQFASRCFLGNKAEEKNNHLHCKVTSQLWSIIFSLSQTQWSMPEHTADLLSFWIRRGGSKNQTKWCRIIPVCIR